MVDRIDRVRGSKVARRSEGGFSIIELMISIMVLLVGVVAVAELVPKAIQMNFKSRNNSTAIVVAQEMMEQIAAQTVDQVALFPCTEPQQVPLGHYGFCDSQGFGIGLGRIDTGTVSPLVLSDGCPLDAAGEALNFSVAVGACPAGYSVVRDIVWDVNSDARQSVEIRWHIVTLYRRTVPIRKVIIVGARVGRPAEGYIVRNLQTVVGR